MKHLLLILFLFTIVPCTAQTLLGQSRASILKGFTDCFVLENTTDRLGLNCNDIYFTFSFFEYDGLCYSSSITQPDSLFSWYLKYLENEGFSLSLAPAHISKKPGFMSRYCRGEVHCTLFDLSVDGYFVAASGIFPPCK